MIWHPKPGDRVEIRYNKRLRKQRRCRDIHGQVGTVDYAGRGPGPINARVKLDDGKVVVVARGNLFLVKEAS